MKCVLRACPWDKGTLGNSGLYEREPAPQPGKGPVSTATVLTAPGQWHLPTAEAVWLSMKEGEALQATRPGPRGGCHPPKCP